MNYGLLFTFLVGITLIISGIIFVFTKTYKDNKAQNEKVFKLQECFQIYQIQNEFKGYQTQCTNCGYSGTLFSNYFFETSPLYLIIVINRTKTINLEYTENLELPKDTESNITIEKYK